MECTENQWVSFTSFMFQGEAERWWEMVKGGAKTLAEEISETFQSKSSIKSIYQGSKGQACNGIPRFETGSIDSKSE